MTEISGLAARRRQRIIQLSPPAVLILLYVVIILVGAAILMLPFAAHEPTGWFDALFTATSAVTVTGLVVVDTGSHYTLFGQFVVMVLIQLGGLGLMTFAVLVFALLGLPMAPRHQLILREDLNQTDLGSLMRLVWLILRVVIVLVTVGTILLAFRFVPEFGWQQGLWQALFHAISAANNAGFGLFSDSLSRWVGDPLVNVVVSSLFIIGGIGYTVLTDLYANRNWRSLNLHSKLMLAGTAALILWSVATFLMLEWRNPETLGGLDSISARLWAGWFQAVTTRTAGFNTLDTGALHDSTALMMISLMLIGGGSTSTAGGLKVTTFVVLLLATMAFLRRRNIVSVFGRSIPLDQVLKVLALMVLSLFCVVTALFIVTLTNDQPFLDLAFEVASAFGTVGLSRGVTADLDPLGRSVIIVLMFIGRLGPLALGFSLATRTMPRVRYPSAQVYLG